MKNVLLIQCDGKMPNLALMRIAAHHRKQGDSVHLQSVRRKDHDFTLGYWDRWNKVYASLIFASSQPIARRIKRAFPDAILGGSGWGFQTTDQFSIAENAPMDYSLYPACRTSIGFTQRGCRLDCGFCLVHKMEGDVRDVATVNEVWRGEPWPRELILLDNDFFGSPTWREKIAEIRDGRFKVSITQGINARMLSEQSAAALASIDYRADNMKRPCIHTAWDNLGDERPLFRGLNALKRYGVKPDHITVYMLVGFENGDLSEADFERHRKLREFGCRPYPMPFIGADGERASKLTRFQTWVLGAYDKRGITWERFWTAKGQPKNLGRRDQPLLELATM